jgi:hypothetical protein
MNVGSNRQVNVSLSFFLVAFQDCMYYFFKHMIHQTAQTDFGKESQFFKYMIHQIAQTDFGKESQ